MAPQEMSWLSGYIEGKAFRNGYIATPSGSRVPLRKNAFAAEPLRCSASLHSSGLRAAQHPGQMGGKFSMPIDRLELPRALQK